MHKAYYIFTCTCVSINSFHSHSIVILDNNDSVSKYYEILHITRIYERMWTDTFNITHLTNCSHVHKNLYCTVQEIIF